MNKFLTKPMTALLLSMLLSPLALPAQTQQPKKIVTRIEILEIDQRVQLPDVFADYTERVAQEIHNAATETDALRLLSKYRMKLSKNNADMSRTPKRWVNEIRTFYKQSDVYIEYAVIDREYTIEWKNGRTTYKLVAEINRENIEGRDKAEAEKHLFQTLNNLPQSNYVVPLPKKVNLTSHENGLLVNPGVNYVLASMDGSTFYKETSTPDGLEAVFSKDYPTESLKNLMMGVVRNNKYTLHLAWPVYGGELRTMDISLKSFVDFWRVMADYNVFCGVSAADTEYSVVFIIMHKVLQYANVCVMTFKTEDFDNGEAVLNATFTTNIPQHNINDIYN